MLLSNIPWMAPDRMAFTKNYTNKQIKLKWSASPLNNFFKYWQEYKMSNNNECLQQNNFICTQLNPTLIYMIQKN